VFPFSLASNTLAFLLMLIELFLVWVGVGSGIRGAAKGAAITSGLRITAQLSP